MNLQQFFQWISDPSAMKAEDLGELKDLIAEYPYFQAARTLFLLNLRMQQDYRFEPELKKVATYSPDRARLRELILSVEEQVNPAEEPAVDKAPDINSTADKEKDDHLKILEEQIRASLKEIELNKSRLNELIKEKEAITGQTEGGPDDSGEAGDKLLRPLPKDKLLEDFLQNKPVRSGKKAIFYNPEDSAKKSIEENEDILSETLARLVAAQGKNDKAIKIYQKLMLKYPQKSSYFAAQIEKLRKES